MSTESSELVKLICTSVQYENNHQQLEIQCWCGLVLNNDIDTITTEMLNEIKITWLKLPKHIHIKIKETLLFLLNSSNSKTRKLIVNAILILISFESIKEWNNLLPILTNKSSSMNNPELSQYALKCYRIILQNKNRHNELLQFSSKILEQIVHGMSKNTLSKIKCEAMKCLYFIIDLISSNMQIEKERNIIIQIVCCGCSMVNNSELKLYSFKTVSKLIKYYYDLMDKYMQPIFQIVHNFIKQVTENNDNNIDKETEYIAAEAMNVWCVCAEIESDSSIKANHGYVNKVLELLIPLYLKLLLTKSTENILHITAMKSLKLFSETSKNNVCRYVLQFVEQNVFQKNKNREAALYAYGCILKGPDKSKLLPLTQQIYHLVEEHMCDEHLEVKVSATWLFGQICEFIPESVDNKKIELQFNRILLTEKSWKCQQLILLKLFDILNGSNCEEFICLTKNIYPTILSFINHEHEEIRKTVQLLFHDELLIFGFVIRKLNDECPVYLVRMIQSWYSNKGILVFQSCMDDWKCTKQ
eukprot:78691_1